MNWLFTVTGIALYLVFWYLNQKQCNKKIRILKWIIFCIATVSLGTSVILRTKEVFLENDAPNTILGTIIIFFCIVVLGIGITGLKKSITDNHDSQK